MSKFLKRLDIMRDLYREVNERDTPWDPDRDANPWVDSEEVPARRWGAALYTFGRRDKAVTSSSTWLTPLCILECFTCSAT